MIKLSSIIFSLLIIISTSGMPMAARISTPTEPPDGVRIISIDEASQLINQKNIYVFDMRKELYYGKGHIPGAVSLPYKWSKKESAYDYRGEFDMTKLPADKNAVIIFHCNGPEDWKSYYTSKAAKKAGYTNIMWLREGYSTWTNKGYAVEH